MLGNQSAIIGNAMISATVIRFRKKNGMVDLTISPIVTSGGDTPFKTNRSIPNGGEYAPISIVIKVTTANQIVFKPNSRTIGINIGNVIIIILTGSIKQPKIKTIICIIMKMIIGDALILRNALLNPIVAPENAST